MTHAREPGDRRPIGISPDSWGVWFAEDPRQPAWADFLDGARATGYGAVELGPLGYLPTDAATLKRELGSRELRLSGAFVAVNLAAAARGEVPEAVLAAARLTAAADGEHMLVMDEPYVNLMTGSRTRPEDPMDDRHEVADGLSRLVERFATLGLQTVLHPHPFTAVSSAADIDAVLSAVDQLELCVDLGQLIYVGADPVQVATDWLPRVSVVHLKDANEDAIRMAKERGLPFVITLAAGLFTELGRGSADLAGLVRSLGGRAWPGWWVVEQPLYPVAGANHERSAAMNARAFARVLDG